MAKRNKPVDVFKYIDMQNGPLWTDPETGETSRCWPFTGQVNSEGRPYIQINGKKVLAYRQVYELATGEELGTRMFRHKCDNQICCNFAHGIPGSHEENMDDMKTRERHGMSHHMVRYIRKQIAAGHTNAVISEITGASKTAIQSVRDGSNYSHVKNEEEVND